MFIITVTEHRFSLVFRRQPRQSGRNVCMVILRGKKNPKPVASWSELTGGCWWWCWSWWSSLKCFWSSTDRQRERWKMSSPLNINSFTLNRPAVGREGASVWLTAADGWMHIVATCWSLICLNSLCRLRSMCESSKTLSYGLHLYVLRPTTFAAWMTLWRPRQRTTHSVTSTWWTSRSSWAGEVPPNAVWSSAGAAGSHSLDYCSFQKCRSEQRVISVVALVSPVCFWKGKKCCQ